VAEVGTSNPTNCHHSLRSTIKGIYWQKNATDWDYNQIMN